MKNFWKEFLFRGLICAAGGPLVLAVIYGILGATGAAESIPSREVCTGILTIMLLAFIAAGLTGEQYRIITESNTGRYKVKFKILEIISELFGSF